MDGSTGQGGKNQRHPSQSLPTRRTFGTHNPVAISILVLHGPNLQLLGTREPSVYGPQTLQAIDESLAALGSAMGVKVTCRQSNHEGDLVTWMGEARGHFEGVVLNAAAYTHTSVAIADAVRASGVPTVEVHLSNVAAREAFRSQSWIAPHCIGSISGFGMDSYLLGVRALIDYLHARKNHGH